jgi:hypothetical protein
VLAALALALGLASLVSLNQTASAFYAEKTEAVERYERCLEKISEQTASGDTSPATRSGIWPCFHQQITAHKYDKELTAMAAMASPTANQRALYSIAAIVLLSAFGAALKQR